MSLFIGMGITFKEFFKPTVTVAYPYETLTMSARYRGHIELVEDEEGKPQCVVCGLCEKVRSIMISASPARPAHLGRAQPAEPVLDYA